MNSRLGNSSSSSSSAGNNSSNKRQHLTKEEKIQGRKARNIESAKRSRDRLKHSDRWVMLQIEENKDMIAKLEKQVDSLTTELLESPRKSSKKKADRHRFEFEDKSQGRPEWFGEPF